MCVTILEQRECVIYKPVGRVCHVPRESERGLLYGLTLCLGETKSSLEPLIKVNIPVFQFKAADF